MSDHPKADMLAEQWDKLVRRHDAMHEAAAAAHNWNTAADHVITQLRPFDHGKPCLPPWLSYRKVGGIHFVKVGRFGFTFWFSKRKS